ncbi:hypothetical protein Y032_0085g1828 [Ancylostoma ceylanicum]|nr:hypothetical protein Y032_0085g1828 [Ancylostoma ceylanicum]
MRSLPADPRAAATRRSRMASFTPLVAFTLLCSVLAQNYGSYQNFNPNPSVAQYPQYQYQGQPQPSYQQGQPLQYQRDQSLQYQQGQIQQYPQGQTSQYQQGYNKQYPQGQVQQYPQQYQRDQSQLYQQGQNQPYQQGQLQSSNGEWQSNSAQNQWQAPVYNSTNQYGMNQPNYGYQNTNSYQSTTQQPYSAQYDDQPKDCNAPRIRGDFCSGAQQRQMFYYDAVQKICQPFMYNGCNGNGNRFDTAAECKQICVNGNGSSQSQLLRDDANATLRASMRAACQAQYDTDHLTPQQCSNGRSCAFGYECTSGFCCPSAGKH